MRHPATLAISLVGLLLVACDHPEPSAKTAPNAPGEAPLLPAPVGGKAPGHDEEELGEGRARWIERMHRAAPGIDWRAIEARNHAAETARRNVRNATPQHVAGAPFPWSEVGSKNQAGRVHCAAIGTDQQTLYTGSDRGGTWRGNLDGTGWTPIGDNIYGATTDLAVIAGATPADPDVVITVTDGALKVTRDGGLTWETPSGTAGLNSANGLAVLQDAAGTIVFYGRASGFSRAYRSTDDAQSFQVGWSGADWAGWMWAPRTGAAAATDVYLVHQGRLYRSTNAGVSYSQTSTINAAASSAELTGSEAGAPTLYAVLNVGGQERLYQSTDGGSSFSQKTTLSSYWGELCADITNPNLVMYGNTECYRSTNGGSSFSKINSWGEYYSQPASKLHADIFGLYCLPHPTSPGADRWYICTDGGLYQSDDGGATVLNLSLDGLGISQYYSSHTSTNDPRIIAVGAQDQGYQRGIWKAPLPAGPSTPFDQLISGDYGHLTSSDGTHDYVYSTYPGFILAHVGENNPNLVFVDFPSGSNQEWMPPVVADPLDKTAFFFCADKLWRYTHSFNIWTPTQHSTVDFAAGPGSFMTGMAFAPTDPQRAYAVNEGGKLFVTSDHGVTWANPAGGAPAGQYFYGHAIAVSPTDKDECVVGGSGYSNPGVLRTQDGGQTWTQLTAGLPATLVYGLAYAADGSNDVFAATESGVYMYDRIVGVWTNAMENQAPVTTYWSVEAIPSENRMRFGTYGRGIWDLELMAPGCSLDSYGTGELGSTGETASIAATGLPSVSDPTFALVGAGFASNSFVVLMTGTQATEVTTAWGHILVGGPVTRTWTQSDGQGELVFPISVTAAMVGSTAAYQFIGRDPGFGGNLQASDGLLVSFCP